MVINHYYTELLLLLLWQLVLLFLPLNIQPSQVTSLGGSRVTFAGERRQAPHEHSQVVRINVFCNTQKDCKIPLK